MFNEISKTTRLGCPNFLCNTWILLTIIAQPKETDEEWKIGEERDAPL